MEGIPFVISVRRDVQETRVVENSTNEKGAYSLIERRSTFHLEFDCFEPVTNGL
jgi:hypothetical protein